MHYASDAKILIAITQVNTLRIAKMWSPVFVSQELTGKFKKNYDIQGAFRLSSFNNLRNVALQETIFLLKNRNFCPGKFSLLNIHKPSLGSGEVPHNNWARSVHTFIDTNRQTSKGYLITS